MASVVAEQVLEHGIQLLWYRLSMPLGTWNRPRPEVELMSLALAGRFLITGPLGRFYFTFLNIHKY